MTLKRALAFSLVLALAWAGLALAAEVIQGTCSAMDEKAGTLTIKDELDGQDKVFDIKEAKVGAKPEPGNILRVAFKKQGDKNVALKVMNITKQDLRKN